MSYDLTLIRSKPGTMRDWADFQVWEDGESTEACDARAQQLWQDAGIDPVPVE